jgi:uncharacterized membrane protein
MNDHYYMLCLFGALILTSLTAGILSLYAHTIMPGLKRVDGPTFVKSFQSIDRAIINPIFMVQFFLPMLLLPIAFAYASSQHFAETGYILVAAIAYAVVLILTMAINVPLNDGIKRVGSASTPQQFDQARAAFNEARWSLANMLRTFACLIAVVCTAIAVYLHN